MVLRVKYLRPLKHVAHWADYCKYTWLICDWWLWDCMLRTACFCTSDQQMCWTWRLNWLVIITWCSVFLTADRTNTIKSLTMILQMVFLFDAWSRADQHVQKTGLSWQFGELQDIFIHLISLTPHSQENDPSFFSPRCFRWENENA